MQDLATNLARVDKPLDWTHEREWRLPAPLSLRDHPQRLRVHSARDRDRSALRAERS